MKNMIKLFGVIVLTALIGIALVSCDDGGGGNSKNEFDEFLKTLSSGKPSSDILVQFELSDTNWNSSSIGTTSGYKGWYYDSEEDDFGLVFSNMSQTNFEILKSKIETLIGKTLILFVTNEQAEAYYSEYGITYNCFVEYIKKNIDTGEMIVPAGTVTIGFADFDPFGDIEGGEGEGF